MAQIQLTDEQYKIVQAAVQWFKTPNDQVFEYEGPAGTGKSVTAFAILEELGLNQDQYLAMAYTGQAAIVMRTRGFQNAKSIHSQLYEVIEEIDMDDISSVFGKPKKKFRFQKKTFLEPQIQLLFIDEAYMVPQSMMKDILSFGIKVIAAGDARQLPPVKDKPAFLTDYNRCHHLTKLMRQAQDDPIIYLANRIIAGDPIHCGTYGDSVMVINDDEFLPEMIGYADIMITGTNRTRDICNRYVRKMAGYDTQWPMFGERLICRNNNWNQTRAGISLANGLIGTVVSIFDQSKFDGKTFPIDFRADIIQAIFDGIDVDYKYFVGSYEQRQELKNNLYYRRFESGEFFEYAYAITTHLSQGSEHEKGIIINEYLHPQMQKALDYTAITRFKKSCIIVKKTMKDFTLPM